MNFFNLFYKKNLLFILLLSMLVSSCSEEFQESGSNEISKISSQENINSSVAYSTGLGSIAVIVSGCTSHSSGTPTNLSTLNLFLNTNCTFEFPSNAVAFVFDGQNYYGISGQNTISSTTTNPKLFNFSKTANSSTVALKVYISTNNAFPAQPYPTFNFLVSGISSGASVVASASVIAPQVVTGDNFSCALVFPGGVNGTTNKIYCWGKNDYVGFTGSGLNTSTPTAINLSALGSNYPTNIYAGDEVFCLLTNNKRLWCVGILEESYVQKTLRDYTSYVSGTILQVALGYESVCVLTTNYNDSLQCFGNLDYKFNNAMIEYAGSTASLSFSGAISQFAIASNFSGPLINAWSAPNHYGSVCAIVGSDFHVECVGHNNNYQFGTGDNSYTFSSYSETVRLSNGTSLKNVSKIFAKNQTYCAITTSNTTYCWGKANDISTPQGTFQFNMFGSASFASLAAPFIGGEYFYISPVPANPYQWQLGSFPSPSAVNTSPATSGTPQSYFASLPSYYRSGIRATNMNATLNNGSVGMASICGALGSTVSCYGVDLSTATLGTDWNSAKLFSKYTYGSLGSTTVNLNSESVNGYYNDINCHIMKQTCNSSLQIREGLGRLVSSGQGTFITDPNLAYNGQINYWDYSDRIYNIYHYVGNECTSWPNAPNMEISFDGANMVWFCSARFKEYYCPSYTTSVEYNYALNAGCPTLNGSGYIFNPTLNPPFGLALNDGDGNISSSISTNYYYNSLITPYYWSYKGALYSKTTTPSSFSLPSPVYSISVGSNLQNTNSFGHACVALVNGSILCWGGNDGGQVGNGTTGTSVATPTVILSPSTSGLGGVGY